MVLHILSILSDFLGIVGVVLLLVAYYLLSVSKLSAQSMRYQLYNFFGAGFILFSLWFHWNTASFIIEAAWVGISVIGMYRVRRLNNQ